MDKPDKPCPCDSCENRELPNEYPGCYMHRSCCEFCKWNHRLEPECFWCEAFGIDAWNN